MRRRRRRLGAAAGALQLDRPAVAHVTNLLRSLRPGRLAPLPQTVEGQFDGSGARCAGTFSSVGWPYAHVRLRCQRGSRWPARRRPRGLARPRGHRPAGDQARGAPRGGTALRPPQRARTCDRAELVEASSPDERGALRAPAHVRCGHAASPPPQPVDTAPRAAARIAKLTWSCSVTSTCAWCSRWPRLCSSGARHDPRGACHKLVTKSQTR